MNRKNHFDCEGAISKSLGLGQKGVAGIEAAIILPIMIFFIFATVESYQYFRAVAIMDRAAFSVADGIAMQPDLKNGNRCHDTDDICTYGVIMKDLMKPLDYDKGQMTISLFAASGTGNNVSWESNARWSFNCSGTSTCSSAGRSEKAPLATPAPSPGDTILIVQVKQEYEPFVISGKFWQSLGGKTTLTSTAFYRPRFADLKNFGS